MPPKQPESRPKPADSRVTAQLIDGIKLLISNGSVVPGSRFPAERKLGKKFGVNRASLRQAVKVLEIMGVLTQRVGDGTYLSSSAESILNEPIEFLILLDDLSHHELFETRMIVEPELAARAALRATAEDLATLRRAITAMEQSRTTRSRLDADMAFHEAIFRASGNHICHLLFKVIHRTVLTSMHRLSSPPAIDSPLGYHLKIYGALRNRNAKEPRRHILDPLTDAQALMGSANQQSRSP